MRILLTGVTGQLGFELRRTLAPLGQVVACDRAALDLTQADAIRTVVRQTRPQLIVNAAAYTAVDRAECEPALAMAINALAPGILAEEAKRIGASIVHYSTDYVFDGEKDGPYVEDDTARPVNVYGQSKLAGEQAVMSVGGSFLVFRTSWLYGLRGHNFLLTIRRLAIERDVLRVVDDQKGAPTWSRLVAEATALAIARYGPGFEGSAGIYHLASGGETSWCEFARAILRGAQQGAKPSATVVGIGSEDYPTRARRPRNSRLSCDRARQKLCIALPAWDEGLALCIGAGPQK
jgi:dTDP-4-dehydrorhamnose reductase